MRILMITQWFDPEPTFKGLLFARALLGQGHEVQVLTGFPNYPGGRLYPGYRIFPWRRETIDGVRITRVALYPSHSASAVGRAANYLSFAVASTLAALLLRRPDVAYVYHPPGTSSLPAVALKLCKGVPFVIDVQDLWPDTLAATGMVSNGSVLALIGRWMALVYRRAAHVVVLSSGFRQRLVERGVPARKLSVIENWTFEAEEQAAAQPDSDSGAEGHFTIVFAGTMGLAQSLDTVLAAASIVERALPQVRFIFMGGGIEAARLQAETRRMALRNVEFVSRRPPEEMPAIYARASALLVHLRDDPLFEITIPSKTQAYLQTGRPILMGVKGDAAAMVSEAQAGLTFLPEDPQSLAQAVAALVAMPEADRTRMGDAGRRYYQGKLALKRGVERWGQVFGNARLSRCRPDGSVADPAPAMAEAGDGPDLRP